MFIVLILAAIAAMFAIVKAANVVYQKTGVNCLKFLNKALWYVEIFAAFAAISVESVVLAVVAVIVFSGLQFVLCMKAGIVNAVILAVLHGIAGPFIGVVSLMLWCLSLFTGSKTSGLGSLFSINETTNEVHDINAAMQMEFAAQAARDAAQRQVEIDAANAYAQHQGFRTAEEAERTYGIKTGLPR